MIDVPRYFLFFMLPNFPMIPALSSFLFPHTLVFLRFRTLFLDLISDSPDCLDPFWFPRVFIEFFTNPCDMGHDGIVAVQIFFAPHLLEQNLCGYRFPKMAAQI